MMLRFKKKICLRVVFTLLLRRSPQLILSSKSHVAFLEIVKNDLEGEIPSEVGLLTSLTMLDLGMLWLTL